MTNEEMQEAYERLAMIHAATMAEYTALYSRIEVERKLVYQSQQAYEDLREDHEQLKAQVDRLSRNWSSRLRYRIKTILKTRSFK